MRGKLLGIVLAGCVLVIAASVRRFRGIVASDVEALFLNSTDSVGPEQLQRRWPELPEPIQRYLRYAITERSPGIRTAQLKHDGQFRTKPSQRWLPINGNEYFLAARPGFVWNASVQLAPMFWIEARDRFVSGRGNMLVKIESTFRIADAVGPEIDQGSALRWLAESVWFPYAFVGDHVDWHGIDGRRAQATLHYDGLPVNAVVEVDDEGRLTQLRAARYRDVGSEKAILTPWRGRYWDYSEFDGFRVPTAVEVAWEFEGGTFSYARFRVKTLEYNVQARPRKSE